MLTLPEVLFGWTVLIVGAAALDHLWRCTIRPLVNNDEDPGAPADDARIPWYGWLAMWGVIAVLIFGFAFFGHAAGLDQ